MRVGKWGILHRWALGKLNSMGSWCTELSDYMGGWLRRKLNSMGGWCRRKLNSMGGWVKKKSGIALIYSTVNPFSGGAEPFVQCWYHEEQFCEIILNLDRFKRCHFKDFLSGALAALLFSGAEPFVQF